MDAGGATSSRVASKIRTCSASVSSPSASRAVRCCTTACPYRSRPTSSSIATTRTHPLEQFKQENYEPGKLDLGLLRRGHSAPPEPQGLRRTGQDRHPARARRGGAGQHQVRLPAGQRRGHLPRSALRAPEPAELHPFPDFAERGQDRERNILRGVAGLLHREPPAHAWFRRRPAEPRHLPQRERGSLRSGHVPHHRRAGAGQPRVLAGGREASAHLAGARQLEVGHLAHDERHRLDAVPARQQHDPARARSERHGAPAQLHQPQLRRLRLGDAGAVLS